ncbi:MAG: TolB-like 6-bladed beta-propeller domain-containing protein [Bacteroidales bacterium]|nr:TolB-like 6-bladed beta-propeller domain-containing protein [Bacteroidales bacterium]
MGKFTFWFLILSFSAAISGCQQEKINKTFDINGGTVVALDSVATPCILNPFAMKTVGERLVIANRGRDTIFDVFSLPQCRYIASGIAQGVGPDEIYSPQPFTLARYGANEVCMATGHPCMLSIINVDPLSVAGQHRLVLPERWQYTQSWALVGQDSLFAQQGSLPMDWALLNSQGTPLATLQVEVPEEVIRAIGEGEMAESLAKSSLGAVNPHHTRLAVAYRSFPRICIYDMNLRLISELEGEYEPAGRGVWIVNVDATARALYVNLHDPHDTSFTSSTILAIDWEGRPAGQYRVPKAISAFSVDEAAGRLYFSTPVEDDHIFSFPL